MMLIRSQHYHLGAGAPSPQTHTVKSKKTLQAGCIHVRMPDGDLTEYSVKVTNGGVDVSGCNVEFNSVASTRRIISYGAVYIHGSRYRPA